MLRGKVLMLFLVMVMFGLNGKTLKAESLARSIFMSTAGSIIKDSSKKDQIDVKYSDKASKSYKKDKIVRGKNDTQWVSGMQIQILKVLSSGKLTPVNPMKYVFREGDRFKVRVTVNTPGLIAFYNIDPRGEETFLGMWPIERAFSAVELPHEGAFEFYKTKGDDLLIIAFKPCIVTDEVKEALIGYARSIRYVNTELSEKVIISDKVRDSLPMCSFQRDLYNEEKFKKRKEQLISYSRSIRVISDNLDNSIYTFSSNSRSGNTVPTDSFIVHILKLKFR